MTDKHYNHKFDPDCGDWWLYYDAYYCAHYPPRSLTRFIRHDLFMLTEADKEADRITHRQNYLAVGHLTIP